MRRPHQLLAAFLTLSQSIMSLRAQDAWTTESGDRTIALVQGSDSKEMVSADEDKPLETQNWLLHMQGTEVVQGQPGFHSPYL